MSHNCTFLWAEIQDKYNVTQQLSWKRVAQYTAAEVFSYLWFLNFVMIWYDIFVNCNWVATRWQLYSTHLRTNITQNDTKQTIRRKTQKVLKSAGRAPSWRVMPWHLPYNWGTTEEKARKNLSLVCLHMAKNSWLPHQPFVCLLEQDGTDVTYLFTLSILALGPKFCYLLCKRLQCSTFSSSETGWRNRTLKLCCRRVEENWHYTRFSSQSKLFRLCDTSRQWKSE